MMVTIMPDFQMKIEGRQTTKMEEKLRKLEVPLIVRVDKDEILFDLRTVAEDEFTFIIEGLKQTIT
ncbi:MAG: hypothetical protein WAW09_01800 [Smithella sp.]